MAPKKKQSFEDVTVVLNYSQAVRNQMKFNSKYTTGNEWDEETIFHAAQFCKVFHNKTLNPYVIQKFLDEQRFSRTSPLAPHIRRFRGKNARSATARSALLREGH